MQHRAYVADASISSFEVHNLPAFLKRARRHGGLTEYSGYLETALMPLHALLQAAKPLVIKKGEAGHPALPKTPEQIAREASQMTCQCCGGLFLANTGSMAHHGYRRPGEGWQTMSCIGAKSVPFEVGRGRLGEHIEDLKAWEAEAVERAAVAGEMLPVTIIYRSHTGQRDHRGRLPMVRLAVTRESFDVEKTAHADDFKRNGITTFAVELADDLARRDREIQGVGDEIRAQQARYDGWRQTHRWDPDASAWKALYRPAPGSTAVRSKRRGTDARLIIQIFRQIFRRLMQIRGQPRVSASDVVASR